jgi:lipopolysaccharide export system permease protein
VLVVALLAVPLSKTNPRQGRYVQMIPAILLYIVYLVSLNAARGSIEDGGGVLSLWAVHGLFMSIAFCLLAIPTVRLRLQAAIAQRAVVGGSDSSINSTLRSKRKPRA